MSDITYPSPLAPADATHVPAETDAPAVNANRGSLHVPVYKTESNRHTHTAVVEWPLGFCDCCSYRDSNGSCQWCPYFIPMGLCGTCFLVGKVRSLYVDEKIYCCDMGPQGCCLCLLSTPFNIFTPLGGFCWFAWHSAKMRSDIVRKYNIDDSKAATDCCCMQTTCCAGLVYPCSLFQVLMTQREFESQEPSARMSTRGALSS